MVFGFGKKFELELEKQNFAPGDSIKGKVWFDLKKPIKARQLKVLLIAEKVVIKTKMDSWGSHTGFRTVKEKANLYHFELKLDGEKEYSKGEYAFELKIPKGISLEALPQGTIGNVLSAIENLSVRGKRIDWFVQATLDVPMGFDVSKKVQITVE